MEYEIRKVKGEEVDAALKMVWKVFLEFESPQYAPEGTETFRRDIVENIDFYADCQAGMCPLYGAFDGKRIIGVMGLRKDGVHVNLAFVDQEYHRRGVGSALFRFLLSERLRENPEIEEITLNASPYGVPFYRSLGFEALSGEREKNGIRYTPMKYEVKTKK